MVGILSPVEPHARGSGGQEEARHQSASAPLALHEAFLEIDFRLTDTIGSCANSNRESLQLLQELPGVPEARAQPLAEEAVHDRARQRHGAHFQPADEIEVVVL